MMDLDAFGGTRGGPVTAGLFAAWAKSSLLHVYIIHAVTENVKLNVRLCQCG
jgi:hypothetical protein